MSSTLPAQQQQLSSSDDDRNPSPIYSESSSSSDNNLEKKIHEGKNDHINQTDEEEKADNKITTNDLHIDKNEGSMNDVEKMKETEPASNGETMTSASVTSTCDEITSEENAPPETQDNKQRTRRANVVTIQDDASTAFSPYTMPSLVAMNRLKKKKSKKKTKRGKLNQKENSSNTNLQVKSESTSDHRATIASDLESKPQHYLPNAPASNSNNNDDHDDRDSMLQNVNDPILQHYLPKLTFLNDNYYTKVKPYDVGRRNLPPNQIELILRRRAVKKKKEDTPKGEASSGGGVNGNNKRPPLSTSTPTTRRKVLFPPSTQQQQQQQQQHYDDDSTISSATAASTWTAGSKTLYSRDTISSSPAPPTQNYITSHNNPSPPIITPLPQEEIVGDTSLGLKLTILQGKVIIQAIDPLNDGRASPAQLCGSISPGDILIAVNGKSLINGTIHNPAPMDRIISVLKPLSQPLDEVSGEYSREVRLRLVLGEGVDLLREQKRLEAKKREDMERRKALGLDRPSLGGGGDAAGDIFGIASFMAVDQHSGMPLFGHLDLDHHLPHNHDVSKVATTTLQRQPTAVTDNRVDSIERKEEKIITTSSLPVPQTLQEKIAQQVALDRQWMRNRNTSEFFSLDNDASVLLRPPTPLPTIDEMDSSFIDPIEARKQMLARGEKVMNDAKSLLTLAEFEDRRVESFYADEDPMEVASRVCGTASIRTGASKRRWHRGDSVVAEDEDESTSADADDNASVESVEECDHRRLIDLAANDDSWKVNVLKRLELFAQDTEKESNGDISTSTSFEKDTATTGFDAFLFGGDVSTLMKKKKQSLALPPGEMTAMLFDLVDHLSTDFFPGQIFVDSESGEASKSVSFSKNLNGNGEDTKRATEFLLDDALRIWLKTFRPLPWTQRRAIWRKQSGGNADASIAASTLMDDNMSLSMASGSANTPKAVAKEREKRNLREVIEEMELDAETRTETCRLVTFYFTRKCASQKSEAELATLIDTHGSYLDLHPCLVAAGKLRSKLLIEKLLEVAKYDSRHKESMKHLKKSDENVLVFYEPQMLSPLLEKLTSLFLSSGDFNHAALTALLVSAYPDVQPWCVREVSRVENAKSFYFNYMSSLLHHEEGNDAARRDKELVKEWCLMLSSQENAKTADEDWKRKCFLHIASRDDESSILYHRDLPFLMDTSTKMSEYSLALDIANEIVQSMKYRHNKQVLEDVLNHLKTISCVAIKGSDGDLNTTLLGQVITFFNVLAPCLEKHQYEIDIIAELTKLLELCRSEKLKNALYSPTNVDACITCVSENAPPSKSLQVFSQWEHSSAESSSLVSAIQTSLIRGAREGLQNELSGSLLRIKRAREEGHVPMMMQNELTNWDTGSAVADVNGEEEEEDEEAGGGGFIWKRVLDGTLQIAK